MEGGFLPHLVPSKGWQVSRMSSRHGLSRRHFIAALPVVMAPAIIGCRRQRERLRTAAVGAGGQGETDIRCSSSEDIVAICDVDENMAAAQKAHPRAEFSRIGGRCLIVRLGTLMR